MLLTIAGVAHRLLPMFLLSHGASERPGKIAVGLLGGGVTALLVLHHHLTPALTWTIGATLAAGTFALVTQAALHFQHRRRVVLDAGMHLAAGGLVMLMVAIAIAPFFVGGGTGNAAIATAYVTAAVGAVSLFVAGHYYRIVPFLIWFHRFGPLVGKREVLQEVPFSDVRRRGSDTDLLRRADQAGFDFVAFDFFNFALFRSGQDGFHTWNNNMDVYRERTQVVGNTSQVGSIIHV